jgi:5-methylcytosine-specific restriction endonuclease McrA
VSVSPLDKALFLQGGLCFFCNKTLSNEEASVDHLVPKSRCGTNESDNLVACCKTLNSLFGDMTLKEKLRVVLNQKGKFVCPCLRDKNLSKPQQLPLAPKTPTPPTVSVKSTAPVKPTAPLKLGAK